MIKRLAGLCLIIFLLSGIYAQCDSNQVNINSASAEELDKIVNIGPARAEQIINLRPFESVNDLIKINGIGDATLSEIKQQGLACVDEESEEQEQEDEEEKEKESNEEEEDDEKDSDEEDSDEKEISRDISEGHTEINSIILNPLNADAKTIKSEDNKENPGEGLAFYGIIAFCGVFGALLLLNKRKYKNEFR